MKGGVYRMLTVERRLNFYPEQVKIVKDMEQHITYFYRIKPQNF